VPGFDRYQEAGGRSPGRALMPVVRPILAAALVLLRCPTRRI
jgi:hypothetical protein